MSNTPHDPNNQNNQPAGQPPQNPYGQPPQPQQPPYGAPPPHGQSPYQPPGGHPYPQPEEAPSKTKAVVALVLGIAALTIPVPVVDIIAGIAGIILALASKREGVKGLAIAALVVSIIGTLVAISFTADVFFGDGWIYQMFYTFM